MYINDITVHGSQNAQLYTLGSVAAALGVMHSKSVIAFIDDIN